MNKRKYSRLMLLRYFVHLYNKLPAFLLVLFLLNLIIVSGNFLNPYIYSIFINDVLVERQFEKFFIIVFSYILVLSIMIIVRHIALAFQNLVDNRIIFELKNKYLNNLLWGKITELEKISVGEMKIGMEDDINSLSGFINKQIISYFINLSTFGISVIFLFSISWQLTLVLLIITPFILIIDHLLGLKENILAEKNRNLEKLIVDWLNVGFENWKEIKSLCLNKYFKRKYVHFTHKLIINNAEKLYYFAARYLIIPTIRDKLAIQVVIYSIGGILVINNSLSVGTLLIFAQYYSLLTNAIKTVSLANADLMANQTIIERVMNNLTDKSKDTSFNAPENISNISFDHVSMAYQEGLEVLKNVSFQISTRKRVVIYGESGSGKSTIIKLISGLLKPTEGKVSIEGCSISEIDSDYLYKKIGIIMQNAALFDLSIKENLLLAKADATEDEIERACRDSLIWEDIKKMPKGLDTSIGENGNRLSGGQRQRLILARQLLKNNDVLILDEATSNMDEMSERLFYEALLHIWDHKAVILVNHNMKVLPDCDQYVLVKDGKVIIYQGEDYKCI